MRWLVYGTAKIKFMTYEEEWEEILKSVAFQKK